LTLSFVRKLEAGRPLALGRYWLHVFKRLLPLAVLTILGTLVLAWWFFPAARIEQVRTEALASVLYVENWALAAAEVDYYTADASTASPFQHFWSLSVQGQVFLLWPLVFGAAWLLCRGGRWRPVPVLAVCFGVIFAASLAWSVHTTATDQAFAYFDTRTRLWEFALGSLLALAVPYLHPPRGVRVALGWVGLASMVAVGALVDVQGAFPGWIALWPLLSAAAIIVAGRSGSPFGLDRVLASRPLVRLGGASYALYLIHWPLLITYLVLRDRPVAGPRSGVAIVVVSLVLAVLATKLVERPFQGWGWPERNKRRLAVSVAVGLALVAVPVLAWEQVENRRAAEIRAAAERNNPGAAVLEPDFEFTGDPDAPTLPLPEDLAERPERIGEPCPEEWTREYIVPSHCHVVRESESGGPVVYAIGNSHIEHWIPTLELLAEERDWTLITFPRPGCFFTEEHPNPEEQCSEWYDSTRAFVEANPPDVLFTLATYDWVDEDDEELLTGYRAETQFWTDRGITVLGIRDNPRWSTDHTQCALENGTDDPPCGRPLGQALGP
ncbi:acyltransferase family protein, partial [Kocuria rosea]|uniref:acyltransferase family protein n=1 Tax=Kocuria rosea TaxID=1275 RepID=UPI00203B8BB7|nr:acyltransferase [Kocuria rosea]